MNGDGWERALFRGPGLVLGPVAGFFVGGSSCSFCRSRKLSLSTAKPVKQVLLHLLPGKGEMVMSAVGGLQAAGILGIGCWHLQHWHCRGHGRLGVIITKEQTVHSIPYLLVRPINISPVLSLLGRHFLQIPAENQGHFLVTNIKYQLKLDKQNDGHAFSTFRQCQCPARVCM